MVDASWSKADGSLTADLVASLRALVDGRKIDAHAFQSLKDQGCVAGTRAIPSLTAKGAALLHAQKVQASQDPSGPTDDGASYDTLLLPDTIGRLAKPRKGEALLVALHDVAAAERFTRDLNLAGIRQRTTQSWSLADLTRSGSGSAGQAGRHEPVSMLDARERVAKACKSIGPDFSGLLIDLCLYEKSLATIEHERQWPARSGKLAIALGLKALSRYYGLDREARG